MRLVRAAAIAFLLTPTAAREAFASPGSFVYVAASSCDASSHCTLILFVYDAATSALVTTIPIATGTTAASPGLAISPDGSRVYVSVSVGGSPAVIAVDTTRHHVIGTVGAAPPGKLAVSRDGHILFTAVGSGVYLFDTSTGQQITQIALASGEGAPSGIAADPVRDRVYWTSPTTCGGDVNAYDTTLGIEVMLPATLARTSFALLDAFASRDGTRLYLTAPVPLCGPNSGGVVKVVDPVTFATRDAYGGFPRGTADAPGRNRVYVWDWGGIGIPATIGILDRDTFASVGRLTVSAVTSIAVAADELRAYSTTAPSTFFPNAPNSRSSTSRRTSWPPLSRFPVRPPTRWRHRLRRPRRCAATASIPIRAPGR